MVARSHRLIGSFVVSFTVNLVLWVLVSVNDPVAHPNSVIGNIVDVLFEPGKAFATSFISPGHGFAYLVGAPLLAYAFCIVFYAGLTWAVLGLPEWWRNRPWNPRNSNQDWF